MTEQYLIAKRQIKKLNTKDDFYEKVRVIVGYYNNTYWEDWEIKSLQAIADARYSEL